MRKLILISFSVLFASALFAQTPQAVKYQAIARDNAGVELPNTAITVRATIHDGSSTGPVVYQETHAVTTNAFGLFTISIGQGTIVTGVFSTINWSTGNKFLEQEVDFGSGYQNMGTTQLLSVPYALYAETSGNGGPMGPTGPTGVNGTNGINGINGVTGPTGVNGTNGTNGATGPTGLNGTNGTNGVTGATGPTGLNGTNGTNGVTGATGPTGINGTNGTNGVTGATGPTGVSGTNGTNGVTGATGPTGVSGTNGINGVTGATGPTGLQGVIGVTGATGSTGSTGVTGSTGAQGTQGLAGLSDYAIFVDQQASGTDGGTFTSGSWITRTLNTTSVTLGSSITRTGNQITLAAGTYYIKAYVPSYLAGAHQARLYNITASVTTIVGTSTVDGYSIIEGIITVASASVFEIQHQCTTTRATDGLGKAVAFGENVVYTKILIEMINSSSSTSTGANERSLVHTVKGF